MTARTSTILSILLAVLLLPAGTASAQCFTPDGLGGACCSAPALDLPDFPDTDNITRYICWNDCDVGFNVNVRTVTTHNSVACGYAFIRFDITNTGGGVCIWEGKLIGAYSRTWAEIAPPSTVPNVQVYRFLVNGDFIIDPFIVTTYGANPCVVPPSYATYERVLVTGYVDYALNCDTNTWSISYALGHECDAYEHDNPFSSRPGFFGNFRTYSWVGPSAGFIVDPLIPAAEGDALNEGMRNFDFTMPLPDICQTEQQVVQSSVSTLAQFCRCAPVPPTPDQLTSSAVTAVSGCGSFALSTPVLIWSDLQSKSIGHWTDPNTYPGPETVHLQQGFFDYTDGCTAVTNRYYMKGAHTQMGWDTFRIIPTGVGAAVPNRLIDLGSAIPLSGDVTMPAVGRRYISDKMIYLNVEL